VDVIKALFSVEAKAETSLENGGGGFVGGTTLSVSSIDRESDRHGAGNK